MSMRAFRVDRLALAALVVLGLFSLSACAAGRVADVGGASGGAASTQPTDRPGLPSRPPPADLSGPRAAVMTYIAWTNYAYGMVNSEVATSVMDPFEHVRVDSYIQLNREQKRGIEQELISFDIKSLGTRDGTATLAAREQWRYRYFSLDTVRYQGPAHLARYDATYTVTLDRKRGVWLVSRVEARALDPVK